MVKAITSSHSTPRMLSSPKWFFNSSQYMTRPSNKGLVRYLSSLSTSQNLQWTHTIMPNRTLLTQTSGLNYSGGDTDRCQVQGLPGLQSVCKSSMTDVPTLKTTKSITVVLDRTILNAYNISRVPVSVQNCLKEPNHDPPVV